MTREPLPRRIRELICRVRGHRWVTRTSFDVEWDRCRRCGGQTVLRAIAEAGLTADEATRAFDAVAEDYRR